METFIRQNLDKIRETQKFINDYLLQKNRGIEDKEYLSVFINFEKAKSSKLIHLKKVIREINLIVNSKLPPAKASQILKTLSAINLNEIAKYSFKSFAIFVTKDFVGFLPMNENIQEGVYVARSLHLKPIIKWVYQWNQYYVITLSQKSIKLLLADDFEMSEVARFDYAELEKSESNLKKSHFFKTTLEKINPILAKNNLTVILAGVNENIDLAKKYCKDPDISIYKLIGNYDHTSYSEIHQMSLRILHQINFDQDIFIQSELREKKNKVEKELGQIIKSATMGKVQKLIVAKDKILWGQINKSFGNYELFINQNLAIPSDDILDDLAEIVLAKGGSISVIDQKDIPFNLEAMAILK